MSEQIKSTSYQSTETYKLLKDLPSVKSGRIIVDEGLFVFQEPTTPGERMYRFKREIISKLPEWFEKVHD